MAMGAREARICRAGASVSLAAALIMGGALSVTQPSLATEQGMVTEQAVEDASPDPVVEPVEEPVPVPVEPVGPAAPDEPVAPSTPKHESVPAARTTTSERIPETGDKSSATMVILAMLGSVLTALGTLLRHPHPHSDC